MSTHAQKQPKDSWSKDKASYELQDQLQYAVLKQLQRDGFKGPLVRPDPDYYATKTPNVNTPNVKVGVTRNGAKTYNLHIAYAWSKVDHIDGDLVNKLTDKLNAFGNKGNSFQSDGRDINDEVTVSVYKATSLADIKQAVNMMLDSDLAIKAKSQHFHV